MKTRVFVYGSLLEGFGNHRLLTGPGVRNLGPASTKEDVYQMFDLGAYPGVCETHEADTSFVLGEVYEVNDEVLERLDRLEGNGSLYTRRPRQVELHNGEEVVAWIYLLPQRRIAHLDRIECGDWRAYMEGRAS